VPQLRMHGLRIDTRGTELQLCSDSLSVDLTREEAVRRAGRQCFEGFRRKTRRRVSGRDRSERSTRQAAPRAAMSPFRGTRRCGCRTRSVCRPSGRWPSDAWGTWSRRAFASGRGCRPVRRPRTSGPRPCRGCLRQYTAGAPGTPPAPAATRRPAGERVRARSSWIERNMEGRPRSSRDGPI
jgi:hypothetical protein